MACLSRANIRNVYYFVYTMNGAPTDVVPPGMRMNGEKMPENENLRVGTEGGITAIEHEKKS